MIELDASALPLVLVAKNMPNPGPVLAFYETTKTKNVENRTYLCPRCVLEGYAHQMELHIVYDAGDLVDEGKYIYCESCVGVLHPSDHGYNETEIGVRRA